MPAANNINGVNFLQEDLDQRVYVGDNEEAMNGTLSEEESMKLSSQNILILAVLALVLLLLLGVAGYFAKVARQEANLER
mmetsp:Transcript_40646/g.61965  ORF Transcript_40646/g.61965 Transcript_40646/m.61965 type:complete len:80 (+) Transcript_40646:21-260(+)